MSKSNEEIRKQVEDAYAAKIKTSTSCCDGAGKNATSTVAALAGYETELAQHPEAGARSFGCGNPLAFAGVEQGETVLDLGSGAGLDLLIAAQKVGKTGHVIGVDMTDAMIEKARENVARAGADQVEVADRLVYSAEQLASFGETDEDRARLARLAGCVQSVRFIGRRA